MRRVMENWLKEEASSTCRPNLVRKSRLGGSLALPLMGSAFEGRGSERRPPRASRDSVTGSGDVNMVDQDLTPRTRGTVLASAEEGGRRPTAAPWAFGEGSGPWCPIHRKSTLFVPIDVLLAH